MSHIKAIPLGDCISHHGEKPGSFPHWSRCTRGFFLGAFEILCVKCLFPGCTDPGVRLRKGDTPHSPSQPWEEERTSRHLQLLPAALGFLFLSPQGLPCVQKTESHGGLQSKSVDTQRAPAQMSTCLSVHHALPSLLLVRQLGSPAVCEQHGQCCPLL